MTVVAVAGGTGDIGRLIVDALITRGKHRLYIMSRKAPPNTQYTRDPSGELYNPVLVTDYADEGALSTMLEEKSIHTIISALPLGSQEASSAQQRLIRAADASKCVRRFAPSEFNVDYDLPDSILPYPDKRFHARARRELEKTTLEYTLFVCGMFMDYYGMPNIESPLKPTYSILDLQYNRAVVPGDGQAILITTMAKDVARYVAAAVDLPDWPKVMTIIGSRLSVSELVDLAVEIKQPVRVQVEYYPVKEYSMHRVPILPSNNTVVDDFPGKEEGLRSLLCDLDAAIALGAYDISRIKGCVDLVKLIGDVEGKPMTIRQLLEESCGLKHPSDMASV
ncbi:hypothetical protein G7Z17_g4458 [Cylindrodendrum hubeiense]|uniref:NmrA-like domain-containing protein n=1 Tax=Cylindrodendrum hubeiense TaxID=595255 RepID=A0A9P5HDV3_9HYPO|nr:hypothetical protein G7Z17_g4458 [Cylindrodendrum hubeiense]